MLWNKSTAPKLAEPAPGTHSPPIVVLGMSHTTALRLAVPETDPSYTIINFVWEKKGWNTPKGVRPSFLRQFDPRSPLVCSLEGNFHNVFSLVEHDIRMDFYDPETGIDPTSNDRRIVPYAMIRRHFEDHLRKRLVLTMQSFSAYFKSAKLYLAPPPPIASTEYILAHKGIWNRIGMQNGVAPGSIRIKFYNLECAITEQICAELGFRFLPPPTEPLDADGLVKADYCRKDPVHTNGRYGALVRQQIERELTP